MRGQKEHSGFSLCNKWKMKPLTKAGESGEKTSACEEIQTSVMDIRSLRFLRDNQMEMSRNHKQDRTQRIGVGWR